MFIRHSEMTAREEKAIVAFWLIPAEPARTHFGSLIAELASRFDAPVFEPHLTLFAIAKEKDFIVPKPDVLALFSAPRLFVREVKCSDAFTKTVFIQFAGHQRLLEMNSALRRTCERPSNYNLDPHLSLIYKTMSSMQQERLAASIKIPFQEVRFDSVKTVLCPTPIEKREDVEAWRVIDVQRLKDHA